MTRSSHPPRCVLIVSAEMGEGHNAAARALAARVGALWPGCTTQTVDVLRLMGRPVSWLFRHVYRFELEHAPGVYQWFYDTLWRHPWFARSQKRLLGSWAGRKLARQIRRLRPDLVISTYPIGSAGIDWLRRSFGRGLEVPAGAFITDFAAHPFWVFPGLDLHFVMHEITLPDVALIAPGRARVGAPPVDGAFSPGDREAARRRLGLRTDAFIALVAGGAWGVGTLEEAVRALLGLEGPLQVVAVCGRNEALRRRLQEIGARRSSLVVLGWTDEFAEWMRAADVVVTNAGGLTSLEAFRSHRPLVLFDPIPGHGKANAELMRLVGLAVVCRDPNELAETVAGFISDAGRLDEMREQEQAHLSGRSLDQDLRAMCGIAAPMASSWRRALRRGAKTVAATLIGLVVLSDLSFVAGTRAAHAVRGAPSSSGDVVIAVAGGLSPPVMDALEREALQLHVPVTFFVEGRDAASFPRAVAGAARKGFLIEAGTWKEGVDRGLIEPWDARSDFARTAQAVEQDIGASPRYVAEPGNRFSVVAAAVTTHLGLRRVVFSLQITAPLRGGVPTIRPGDIVEILISPRATLTSSAEALRAVARSAVSEGLRPVTVAQIDAYS